MGLTMERVGVSLAPSKQIPLDGLIHLAKRAERLGFESIWVPETWGFDAVSLLAVLARETETIKLASGVLNVFSRSAALLAQTAASLQALSDGRFRLGLGASGPIVVQDWHGTPYRRPVQRTRDYVAVVRLALAGERVSYRGEDFQLRGFSLLNPPAHPVPIYLAALGPRNVHLTGEVADGWLPIFAARGHMRSLFVQLEQSARSAGRDPGAIDVASYLPVLVSERSEHLLRQQIAYYVGGMGTYYAEFVQRMGFREEASRIHERWQCGDRRGAVAEVSERLLDACTLGGTLEVAAERIAAYRQEGIALPILTFPHGSTPDEVLATLESLAPSPPADSHRL